MMDFSKDSVVTKSLTNSLKNNKLSHAYLVVGEDSLYCDEFIMKFVKAIFCMENDNKEFYFCGECKSCRSIDHNNYVDFYKIASDSTIKKEEIQELKADLSVKSFYGKKVYWIKDVEKMTEQASNSLLKFLEEPEEDIIAILSCKNTSAVLSTIISRCQQLKLLGSSERIEEVNEEVEKIVKAFIDKFKRKPHLGNIYLLNNLKNKEEIVAFFDNINKKLSASYNEILSIDDVKNKSSVQEKVLKAISDIKSNVNSVLVLEKFLFLLILEKNNLEFLGEV